MDFKGITWVGNVYQKFEAMCLEVEDIIVQDTVKYVENQVQTVGATVKKFYSDVVQDLLPESSVDSGKPLSPSMLHEYAPVCSFTKRQESVNSEAANVQQERVTKDTWVIRGQGKMDGSAMKSGDLHADDYSLCTSPRQISNDSGPYRRTKLNAKRIFRKEKLPNITRPRIEKDSSLSTVSIPHEMDFDVETVSSNVSIAEAERFVSREPSHRDNGNGNGNEQSLTAVDSIRSPILETEQSATASVPAGSDDCAKETDEDSLDESGISEKNTKLMRRLSQRPIEESCIIVDRDEVHCVVPLDNKHGKHKSYKIRDAVYSRMRSSRQQEYKRLAGQWCDKDAEFIRECGDKRPSLNHTNESDWELL